MTSQTSLLHAIALSEPRPVRLVQASIAYNGGYPGRGGSPLFAALVTSLKPAASLIYMLPVRLAASVAFAPQNGLLHYFKAMQQTDVTFKNLYHWNLFDAALLLPYFAVMIVLAI
ncbi:MAG: hypothetical protein ABSG51_10290, partial [Terracidiphilus sp.]